MMSYGSPASDEWILDADAAEPIVRHAVESGVTFFDTADMYSDGVSEEVTGRLLRQLFPHRDDYVLATKVYYPMGPGPGDRGLSRKHIMSAVDASLRRLGTDHIDLYQIHRWDYETPIAETMAALHDLVMAGKVRYIGASACYAWQFAKAQHTARDAGWTAFVSMQNRYNLVYREEEREMIPLCADLGVGVLPYSPLARGLLAGNRASDGQGRTLRARAESATTAVADPSDFDVVDAVNAIARERRVSGARVALAWLLHRDAVTAPIVGATKIGHLDDALSAIGLSLNDEEIDALQAPYRAHPVLGHSLCPTYGSRRKNAELPMPP